MYNLSLTKEEFTLHVNGLDAQVRFICQQIAQAPSAGAALKNNLSQLVNIDMQFDKMQSVLTEVEAPKEIREPKPNGTIDTPDGPRGMR